MQWILQDFEDTQKRAVALNRLGFRYSWHKVVPFVGDISPEPMIVDSDNVVLFGSFALWRYAEKNALRPGVFRINPFVHEKPWQPYMLNGPDALFLRVQDIPTTLEVDDRAWFMRPVSDNKEQAGGVKHARDIHETARKVLSLDQSDIPDSSLRHDTLMMLSQPAHILAEWRVWAVDDRVVTYSLYKEGARVTYRHEIAEDALAFAQTLVQVNKGYAAAYVMDICRTVDGLRLLETNSMNAAGFYAADLTRLAAALDDVWSRAPL